MNFFTHCARRSKPVGPSFSKTLHKPDSAGITLVEVVIAVVLLGILITGLFQILGTMTQSMDHAADHQTIGNAPSAMARMVRFVNDTDEILFPADDGSEYGQLKVVERTLDLLENKTRNQGSDGVLDADTDDDTLVNEGDGDGKEYVLFTLDTTDPDNWKLTEQVPDYTTGYTLDLNPPQVICEHVTGFVTRQIDTNVVLIRLTTGKNEMETVLETRARARLLTP
jgi:type II secretory pathway pseudopilin PulG